MITVQPDLVKGKRVLLRYDLDVPIANGLVVDDFRLRAGLPTLKLCLENAQQVIMMGHIGRPDGAEVPELSVAPIYDWLKEGGFKEDLESGKLKLLENLRFEKGESFDTERSRSAQDKDEVEDYAHKLAQFGNFYINEAFASHHSAASTTVLPKLLPHGAGLRFAEEVERLTQVRENPKKPLVVIIGGVKIEDKLPAIKALAGVADKVLVGGKIILEAARDKIELPSNVLLGELNHLWTDLSEESVEEWRGVISGAKMVLWNGPLGRIEDSKNDSSKKLAQYIIDSGAESIVGGGDTVGALKTWGFLEKFSFVSTGGGAMLEFLTKGTLPTIEALT